MGELGDILCCLPGHAVEPTGELPVICDTMMSMWCHYKDILKYTGPCITNVIATRRKNFSQWESSFLWKLRYHWLKFLRRVAKTLVIQGPGWSQESCDYFIIMIFIRPFEKRTYYAMAMSVRLSVRPSVRVFRTFFQRALRYQFETWYMHSVGGTTCRVWVSSQLGHFDLVYSQK